MFLNPTFPDLPIQDIYEPFLLAQKLNSYRKKKANIYIYTQESEDQKCHKVEVEVFPVIKKGKSASLRKQILLSL